MTLAKDITAKFAVAFLAAAMIFTAFAAPASAQTATEDMTTTELMALIAEFERRIAELDGGTTVTTTTAANSSVCPYTWVRNLRQGDTGADVMKLQQFLNDHLTAMGAVPVATAGVGSAGQETMYYGPATAAAVSRFQTMYRSEVLTPVNLVNPTDYFGPSTRTKANSLCVVTTTVETGSETEETNTTSSTNPMSLSGEASLDRVQINSADDDEIEEGAEYAPVAEIEIEFTDGDAEISRMDIALQGVEDPWDVFETVSIWVDGDKVAEEDADDEDEYTDEDNGVLRLSGLDIFAAEDEEVRVVVAVSVQNNVDNNDLGAYTVELDEMRFFDADGVATTDSGFDDIGSTVSFTLEEEGEEDELIVKTSSNDPDAATLQVEDNAKSDWYTVFAFDLDTDDSENDIELNHVPVSVTVSAADFDTLVDDYQLVIDGTTIDDVNTYTNGTTVVLEFDVDGDVVIDAGDRVEAELMLRFKSLDAANEGATVMAEVTAANTAAIDAEGADDLESATNQLRGAAQGEAHTLRTTGIDVSPDANSDIVTVVDGALNDYATFKITVDVTAFEQDVYVPVDGSSISAQIVDNAGVVLDAAPVIVTDSSADTVSGRYEISEGASETLTLTVTYVPGVANQTARMVLDSIGFYDAAAAGTLATQTTLPSADYDTNVETIVD